MKVPFLELKPSYDALRKDMDAAYHRVMESGWYLFGGEMEAFEKAYADSIGVRHCLAVANGLEAMHLALLAAGIGPGDEVIVPSNTYIATWLAVSQVGARLVPCEPDRATMNLDSSRVEAHLTSRTRCILPVHLYGQTADVVALRRLADARNILVLEDAAQSHGATCHGRQSGALGHIAGVSFYPSKNLGAFGDAGAVTTSDDTLAEKIRALRNYGSKVRYHHEVRGINSRLSELQCAFLRVKLPHLAAWNERRKCLAELYRQGLADVGDLVLPSIGAGMEPVWHLFVVRTAHRDALRHFLAGHEIATQVHYPIPPHLSGAYREAGWKQGDFPIAEQMANEVLSLPIGPHLSEAQVSYTIDTIRRYFAAST